MENKTILQGFEWYVSADGNHWNTLHNKANEIKSLGIDGIWLPPAYKGAGGVFDVGYGVYDLYDLGEFNQKNTVRTKYGTKAEYIEMIDAFHTIGLEVYADIVFDHMMGADAIEEVLAVPYDDHNRNEAIGEARMIQAWTKFTFTGRNGMYNDYQFSKINFNGVNYDDTTHTQAIYRFADKSWNQDVDDEKGNFDYLMGADVDMECAATIEQLNKWGAWYQALTSVDGYRLDAVKHIRFTFFIDWLKHRQAEANKDLFVVGEYWHGDVRKLEYYLDSCGGMMRLFDVPLHYRLFQASQDASYDMRYIFEETLLYSRHNWAVTFVDNHDTQQGQSLESWVQDWFRLHAYALILLIDEGVPCIFYGDLYGIPFHNIQPLAKLDILLQVRKHVAYGPQVNYFDHPHLIGFTRFGDKEHLNSGCAVLLSTGEIGAKKMNIGAMYANSIFVDCLGNCEEKVRIEADGSGQFMVKSKSVSVWVSETWLISQQ